MRHLKKTKKFRGTKGEQAAFMRNLANDVIRAGSVETTEARAKVIRPVVERLVTIAKKQTLANRRLLVSRVHNEKDRPGSFTRTFGSALCYVRAVTSG